MKPMEYSSQEKKAVDVADRVIMRNLLARKWVDFTIFPSVGETLIECVERMQRVVKSKPEYSRVVLYIGNEDMIAVVPRGYIPDYIKEVHDKKGKDENK